MRYWALRPDTSDRNSTKSTSSVSCMAEPGNSATGKPGTAWRIARATSWVSRVPSKDEPINRPAAPAARASRATRAASSAAVRLGSTRTSSPRSRLTQLGGVARPRRREMRAAPTLAAAHGGDRARDLPGFHAALHQVVGDRDVHARPVAVGEQHRDRPLVTRPERIHQRPDLAAVVEIALIDVQLDITNPFHVARCTLPAARPEQLVYPLCELAVLLQERLDPLDQVLRLRLEHGGR